MATTSSTTVDFGAGATDATAFVSATGVSSGSMVEAWIVPADTATNTADNHWFDSLAVMAGNVVPGSGFTIYAKCTEGLAHGTFNIGWVHT